MYASAGKRVGVRFLAVGAVILAALAFGAHSGFPVMDDGEMLAMFRERGLGALLAANADRPVNAWLIHGCVGAFGERAALWVGVSLALWAGFALLTARLAKRLLPGENALAGTAALLVLAPIVVEMQFTTLTFAFAGVLPVVLTLGAILLALGPDAQTPASRRALVLAAALSAASPLLSEYAVATAAAGAVLMVSQRRGRAAALVLAATAAGVLVFRSVADMAARPATMTDVQLAAAAHGAGRLPLRWLSGVGRTLAGAYASAAGAVRLDPESRSTLLAAAVGLAAGVVAAGARRLSGIAAERNTPLGRIFAGLVGAVAVGLAAVALSGRDPGGGDFESRLRLPVLAFAAIATALAVDRLVVPRWRPLAAGALAFLAVDAAIARAFQFRDQQAFYADLGRRLRDLSRKGGGLVVGVVDQTSYEVSWAKAMFPLAPEEERRIWVMERGRASRLFGTRGACRGTDVLDSAAQLRTIGRSGPVGRLLWVDRRGDEIVFEPYCVTPEAAGSP